MSLYTFPRNTAVGVACWTCALPAGRQVSNVLRDLASTTGNTLRLDPAVWQSMLAVVDADENGQVEWEELVQFMCDVFKHIERDKVVRDAMEQSGASNGVARIGETGAGQMELDEAQADAAASGVFKSLSALSNDHSVAETAVQMQDDARKAEVSAAEGDIACDVDAAS